MYTDIFIEILSINVAAGYIISFIFYSMFSLEKMTITLQLFFFQHRTAYTFETYWEKTPHEFPCIAEKVSKKISERCIAASHRINQAAL